MASLLWLALGLALGLAWPGAIRAAPGPASRPGEAGRTGPIPAGLRDALRRNVSQYSRRLRRCHELAMAEDRRVGGRVVLDLSVAPAGVVVDVRVRQNDSANALLARCLGEVTRHFVFPAADEGRVLALPMNFARPVIKLTVRLDDVPARRPGDTGVSVKLLLGPRNVTGDRLGLVVARLEKGSALGLGTLPAVVGIHVLDGSLRLSPGAPRPGPLVLGRGEGATLGQAGPTAKLVNVAPGRSAALLYLAPGKAAEHWQVNRSTWARALPARGGPFLVRAALGAVTGDRSLGPAALPFPQLVALAPGTEATLNPTAADMHHALIVTEGVLRVTLAGETITAEVGMGIYLPGKQPARIVPQRGLGARLVVMPWPGSGSWSPRGVYPLVRFTKAGRSSSRAP